MQTREVRYIALTRLKCPPWQNHKGGHGDQPRKEASLALKNKILIPLWTQQQVCKCSTKIMQKKRFQREAQAREKHYLIQKLY